MVHYGLGIGVLPAAGMALAAADTVERRLSDLDLKLSLGWRSINRLMSQGQPVFLAIVSRLI